MHLLGNAGPDNAWRTKLYVEVRQHNRTPVMQANWQNFKTHIANFSFFLKDDVFTVYWRNNKEKNTKFTTLGHNRDRGW